MKFRRLAFGMLLVLMVTLVPGVMAQDNALCGNLPADDCTALTDAFTHITTAGSGTFTLNAAYEVQPDNPAQSANMQISMDGKFNHAAAFAALDIATATSNPGAAVPTLINALKEFSGELNISAKLPPSAVMTNGEPLVLNLLLVNGVGYLDFAKLPASFAALDSTDSVAKGWAGLDFIDILTNIGPGLKSNPSSSTGADIARVQAVIAKHLDYTRDGDTFTANVDLAGLFKDPDFQAMMGSASSGDAQAAANESLHNATCQVVFTLDDDTISQIQVMVHIPESTINAFNAANSSSAKSPTSIDFTLNMTFSNLGETQTISAPADAPVTKFMEFAMAVNRIFTNMVNDLSSQ